MKQIEDALRAVRSRPRAPLTPQRGKWPSIAHAGKAIDQRAAGDQDAASGRTTAADPGVGLLQRCARSDRSARHCPRDTAPRLVMVEKAAAGNDLEMGRDCASPSADRPARGAETLPADRRPGPWPAPRSISARNRRCASSATAAISASRLAKCRNGAPGETPARRAASRDADRLGPALADQLQRGIDQHAAEVAMVIGLRRGGAAGRGTPRLGGPGMRWLDNPRRSLEHNLDRRSAHRTHPVPSS